MADVGKVYPVEIHLLKKALESQGEFFNQERLERMAEIDHLRLELEALKKFFDRIYPGFTQEYEELYAQERQEWNPELERTVKTSHTPQKKTRKSRLTRNVGPKEQYGRIGMGILSALGAAFLPAGAGVRTTLGLMGLAGLSTGISRYCPANRLLRIDNYHMTGQT